MNLMLTSLALSCSVESRTCRRPDQASDGATAGSHAATAEADPGRTARRGRSQGCVGARVGCPAGDAAGSLRGQGWRGGRSQTDRRIPGRRCQSPVSRPHLFCLRSLQPPVCKAFVCGRSAQRAVSNNEGKNIDHLSSRYAVMQCIFASKRRTLGCRVLTFKETDVSLALDDALPLCPAAETLRRVRVAVAKGFRPDEASPARLEHSVVAAICTWACACPRAQIASSVSSTSTAGVTAPETAQIRRQSLSLSAEPQRILFACTLLRQLSEATPGVDTVDIHRSASFMSWAPDCVPSVSS